MRQTGDGGPDQLGDRRISLGLPEVFLVPRHQPISDPTLPRTRFGLSGHVLLLGHPLEREQDTRASKSQFQIGGGSGAEHAGILAHLHLLTWVPRCWRGRRHVIAAISSIQRLSITVNTPWPNLKHSICNPPSPASHRTRAFSQIITNLIPGLNTSHCTPSSMQ